MTNNIYSIFQIPSFISDPGFFLTEEEQAFLNDFAGRSLSGSELPPQTLRAYYKKALLDKDTREDGSETYHTGCFYHFMSVLIVRDPAKVRSLPEDQLSKLRDWYFHQYYDWLVEAGADKGSLKEDLVLPLGEAVSYLRRTEEPVYLTDCECRLFYGNCDRPVHTCLSLGCAPNSPGDRGTAQLVSKDEAVKIVETAERDGLMHTLSAMGICNCCGDCCCMFQSQKRMGCFGVWPVSEKRIRMDRTACIGCGTCLSRCHMGVFSLDSETGAALADPRTCVGCGICVSTCPVGALALEDR